MTPPFPLYHQEDFRIRNHEIGPDGHLTIQSLFNYLVEAAGNHAAKLGVSLTDLFAQGQTWVLSRLHLKMERYPSWPATVQVETWPSAREDLYALRDFRFTESGGSEFGVASSSWMIIDLRSRRPTKIPAKYEDFVDPERGRALVSEYRRLPEVDRHDGETTFQVRLSDLDINRHVYAIHYINWAIESLPAKVRNGCFLGELEVGYRAESVYGDRVVARCQVTESGGGYQAIHNLRHAENGKEFTRLVTRWQGSPTRDIKESAADADIA